MLAAQEVGLDLCTNNWCSIGKIDQATDKLRITLFIWILGTTKCQIGKLQAAQEVGVELGTNNWCSTISTHQTTPQLRIT